MTRCVAQMRREEFRRVRTAWLTRRNGLGTLRKLVRKFGRIAQLGERCPYKAEVTGSIPVPPTS